MFDGDLLRSASGVRVLMQLAQERGMAAEACLAGTALRPETVDAPDARITARQELRAIRNLLEQCGAESGLGVEAGDRYHLSLDAPWGLALLSSRTVRAAIQVSLRYVDLAFVFGRLTFEEGPAESRLVFDDAEIPADVRAFLTEHVITGVRAICRELFSAGAPAGRITFRHPAPTDTTRYREVFGVEPVFGGAINEMAFDSAYLDIALPRANEWARGTCAQLCRDLLTARRVRTGVAGSVRDLLIRNPGEIPDQNAVAAQLFMSSRTLSRRLRAEGASFRQLLDEVRQMMSEELLDHTDMTTEQVAARLGYAEAASFIRAFRRWNGCPPQEFRSRGARAAVPIRSNLVGAGW